MTPEFHPHLDSTPFVRNLDMPDSDVEFVDAPSETGGPSKTRERSKKTGGITKLSSKKPSGINKAAVTKELEADNASESIGFEDDFAALKDIDDTAHDFDPKSDDVLIARKMSNNRVRYYTRQEFSDKYGDTKKLNKQVLLIKGKDGIRRTLPEVYYRPEIPSGTSRSDAHKLRKKEFNTEMNRLGLEYMSPYSDRDYKALKPGDPAAKYQTPGGERSRRHIYKNPAIAGEQLPDTMYLDKKGRRIGAYATLDPMFKDKSAKELDKTLKGLEFKSSNHAFTTPKKLDELFGKGTAEARLLGYSGKRMLHNKNLPAVLVKVGDIYVSAQKLLEHKPDSRTALALKGDKKHMHRLKALVLNEAGTSYMHPNLIEKFDAKHYKKVEQNNKLPAGFSSIGRDYKLGKVMLQTGMATFRFSDDNKVKDYRGKFKKIYGDTRVFTQSDNKFGKPSGVMGMLRVLEKSQKTISKDVAKEVGISPRIGKFDQTRIERQKKFDRMSDSGVDSDIGSNTHHQHRRDDRSRGSGMSVGN
ncbi:VirE2 family protein [Agrobacterium vitis]|uniref:VirE2 family protein n=1 Tax=Agrobacterium vitis TaxID=373 RepID=UPI003D2CFAA3